MRRRWPGGSTAGSRVSALVLVARDGDDGRGFVLSLLAAGIGLGPAVLYALALGMVTDVFAALAGVFAQVVLHSRGVSALGFRSSGSPSLAGCWVGRNDTFWVWLSPWLAGEYRSFTAEPRCWVVCIRCRRDRAVRSRRRARQAPGPRCCAVPPRTRSTRGLVLAGDLSAWRCTSAARSSGGPRSVALAAVMGALTEKSSAPSSANHRLATQWDYKDAADGFLASTQVYLAIIAWATSSRRSAHCDARRRLACSTVLAGALGRMRWLGP